MVRFRLEAFDAFDAGRRSVAAQRRGQAQARGLDAGQRADPLQKPVIERLGGGWGIVVQPEIQRHQDDAGWFKPRVEALQLGQTPRAESCADENHQGQRDLHDDQSAAEVPSADAGFGRAPAAFEFRNQIRPARTKRGEQAEEDAGKRRDPEGEDQDARFQGRRAGKLGGGWLEAGEHVHQPDGDNHSKPATGQGQEHAFGQQAPDQTPASGSQREADGEVARTSGGAGELEIGEVGAGDEQDESGRGEEEIQGQAGIVEIVGEALRSGEDEEVRGDGRKLRRVGLTGEHLHGGLGLSMRHVLLQPAHDVVPGEVAAIERVFISRPVERELAEHGDGHEEVRR